MSSQPKDASAAFILVCPEKSIRETGDGKLERAFQSLALKQHLDALRVGLPESQVAYLPGAGVAYTEGCAKAVVENRWLAVFAGSIDNYAYLVKKYCLEEAGLDPKTSYLLETVRAMSTLSDAEVVALLLKKLGPTFMSKIKGIFAFAVYDAHTGRALTVCDCHASFRLWQAHLAADNSLIISCNAEPPPPPAAPALNERMEIKAGEYKFGWRSAPVAYMASADAVSSRSEQARSAAMEALLSACEAPSSGPPPLRTSFSAARPSYSHSGNPGSHKSAAERHSPATRHSFQASSMPPRPASNWSANRRVSMQAERPRAWSGRAASENEKPSGAWRPVPQPASLSRSGSYVPPHRRHSIAGHQHANAGKWTHDSLPPVDTNTEQTSSWRSISALERPARVPAPAASFPPQTASSALEVKPPSKPPPGTAQPPPPPHSDSSSPSLMSSQQPASRPTESSGPTLSLTSVNTSLQPASAHLDAPNRTPPRKGEESSGALTVEGPATQNIAAASALFKPTVSLKASATERSPASAKVAPPTSPFSRAELAPLPGDPESTRASDKSPERRSARESKSSRTSGSSPSGKPSRSRPIPIVTPRVSRESWASSSLRRPNNPAAVGVPSPVTAAPAANLEIDMADLATEAGATAIPSSAESVIGSGESSSELVPTTRQLGNLGSTANASMLFEWSDTGSFAANPNGSLGASLPSLSSNAGPSPSLRYAVLLDQSAHPETSEARLLLSSVARSLSSNLQQNARASDAQDTSLSFPQPKTAASSRAAACASEEGSELLSPSGRTGPQHASSSTAASASTDTAQFSIDLALVSRPTMRRRSSRWSSGASAGAAAGGGSRMKPSGSFPDVLALLLEGRTTPSPHGSGSGTPASGGGSGRGGPQSSLPSPLQPAVPASALVHAHPHSTLVASLSGAKPADGGGVEMRPGESNDQDVPADLLDKLTAGERDPQVKALLGKLLTSSPCALCIVDAQAADHPAVFVNSRFEEATGYCCADVIGRNLRVMQAPPGITRKPSVSSAAIKRAIRMGRGHTCKLLNFSKSGVPLWNDLSIVPVRSATGAVTHFIGMQTFSPAPLAAGAVHSPGDGLPRAVSHHCLQCCSTSQRGLGAKASSYQVLTALSPDLVSPAGAAMHGCMEVL